MKQGTILIVDDNRNILTTVRMLLADVFAKVVAIANAANIPARLREDRPDVVLLDMNFHSGVNNGNEGLFWLHEIRRLRPQAQVVLFTAYADIELAVRGMREGAADFIVKPFDNAKLVETLVNARKHVAGGARPSAAAPGEAMFWGSSAAMRDLRQTVEKVAPTDANILITGENGTGKEVLAREIHRLSRRSGGPMMSVDLGAVTESLFESEVFGHVRGAFTDAKADKAGKFELASGGTLFLDEIGNLGYGLQAKLLTVLQRRSVTRVGGVRETPIDVRLICATNKDLPQMVEDCTFREDLLYRVNTIHLHLPPLRERRGDIAAMARMFLARYAAKYDRQGMTLSDEAARQIEDLPWPGNIRELQHAMERAVIMADGNVVGPLPDPSPAGREGGSLQRSQTLEDIEKDAIARSIRQNGGNMSAVAQMLGISRQTLYNKIKRYGL